MNLAESLNLGCRCSTLQRPLLHAQFRARSSGAAPAAEDLTASRPHLFSASPVFLGWRDYEAIARSVATLHRLTALPGLRANALERAPEIAWHDFGPRGAFMGYDFHIGTAGPRLIEINTNAGGALLHAAAARAHRACCTSMDGMFAAPADLQRFDAAVFDMFLAEWQAQRGSAMWRSVVIVDDEPGEQYLAPEFELARQLFRAHGLQAVVSDPRELEWRQGRLWHSALPQGMPVDLVYNRLTDFYLRGAGHDALRAAYTRGAVVLTPHPRAHALHADKRNLVALSDGALLADWGANAQDRALLREIVPAAQRVTPADADALWLKRRQLFFKPAGGYGSKSAWRGDKLTRRVWGDILAGDFIAQALVPPSERVVDVAGTPTRLKLDIRAYAYDGRVLLLAARTYAGQTTNFRTPGGGFSPVVVLPPLDDAAPALATGEAAVPCGC
ncbi:MAG: hypothetical protein NDJ19_04015 [Ramlibacter sp.]|nr:hypothetical protein [Ramlibacter sp.]